MRSMDSIDVTNRKPRRFKGTPTYKIRNYTALAVAAYTLISGALYIFSPLSYDLRNTIEVVVEDKKYELENTTAEERDRRQSMFLAYGSILNRKLSDLEKEELEKSGSQ